MDEINQGMDERNERLVFDRIVQNCCSQSTDGATRAAAVAAYAAAPPKKPQYFLVSPKLLQALRALQHDDITVLLVLNGPGSHNFRWFEYINKKLGLSSKDATKKAIKAEAVKGEGIKAEEARKATAAGNNVENDTPLPIPEAKAAPGGLRGKRAAAAEEPGKSASIQMKLEKMEKAAVKVGGGPLIRAPLAEVIEIDDSPNLSPSSAAAASKKRSSPAVADFFAPKRVSTIKGRPVEIIDID